MPSPNEESKLNQTYQKSGLFPDDPEYLYVEGRKIPRLLISLNPEWPEPPDEQEEPTQQSSNQWNAWRIAVKEFCEKNNIK